MTDLPRLAYSRPKTLPQVLVALRRPGACIYAGGTDLLVALQHREPATVWVRELVDIKELREAQGIEREADGLRIGALVTAEALASHQLVRRLAPALHQAATVTSAPLLRARGTVGGNVVTPHPGGDVATALLALGAEVEVVGARGAHRRVPIDRFLASGTGAVGQPLVIAVHVPATRASGYEKLAHRRTFARAMVSAAVAVREAWARVAFGGVSARPVVARIRPDVLAGPALADALDREVLALRSLDATLREAAIALVRRVAARVA